MQYQQALATISRRPCKVPHAVRYSHSCHILCRTHVLASAITHSLDKILHEIEQAPRLDFVMQLEDASCDQLPYRSSGFRQGWRWCWEQDLEEEGMEGLYVG